MRVVISVPTFPPYNSGLGNAVANQARMLSGKGVSVIVCTCGKFRASERVNDNFLVERFVVFGADWLGTPIRGDVNGYLNFLRSSQADVLLLNAWQTWSTDIPMQNLASIPGRKILYSHGLATEIFIKSQPVRSFIRYLLWRPYRWRLRRKLRAVDAFIALAADGCDNRFDDVLIAKELGIPMYVIPNALSDSVLNHLDNHRLREQRSYLIAVGAYEIAKGHDFVMRAYALSDAKNRVPLHFYGQQENAVTQNLRNLGSSLGIDEDFLRFHSGVSGDALIEIYRNAIGFLCGSHSECQPLVLLDAMATGTPFIARASGCIPSMKGGVSVSTEREAAVEIDKLFNEACWAVFAKAGLAAAKEQYHPNQVSKDLYAALCEVVYGGVPA